MWETGTATDFENLAEKLDAFLLTGNAYGLTYAGTGNGTLDGLGGTGSWKGGASSVAETFEITATNATNFTVVGSVSGSIGPATVGTNFTHAKINFRITAGGTAFVSGDKFTLSTAPPAISLRKFRLCTTTPSSGATGASAGENVIDGKTASGNNWSATSPCTIEFTYLAAVTVAEYAIMCGSASFMPSAWTWEHWNGSAWVVDDTRSGQTSGTWTSGAVRAFTVASPVSALRYRLNITAGNNTMNIAAVEPRTVAGGLNTAFSQYIWSLPGNNGTSNIYVGLHLFRRADADYFDWELAAFDGYSASAAFYGQPGRHSELFVPLQNATMTYWFASNGRHVRGVVKLGSQYETFYMGFYDSYFTPAQLPYPIALGGSLALSASKPTWENVRYRWSNTDNEHRAFTHSDPNTSFASTDAWLHQLRARRTDGVWRGYAASHDDSFITAPGATEEFIWPYMGAAQLIDQNLDGSYALFPVVLCQSAPNIYGQLDGIAAVGGQGLTAETLIKVGAVNWLAVPNINRVDRDDWFAFKLD